MTSVAHIMLKDGELSFGIQIGGLHMETINATVSSRGYIVLPARLRKEMNIKAGTKVLLSREENKSILQPVSSFTRKLAGLTVQSFGANPDEVEKFIDREREER
jgi:AbrB family looped-hinge helix DNA binding protein